MSEQRQNRFQSKCSRDKRGAWRERIRVDFQLAIITLFGLFAVLGILPLSVYRFLDGDWRTGVGDMVLMLVIASLVGYAWVSGRTVAAARVLAAIATLGYLVLVTYGSIHVMWAFPILGAGFLLLDRVSASLSALGVLVLTSLASGRFDNQVDTWSFVITGLLVAGYSLVFATRTQSQQRQLVEIASQDPLTGAGNRRALRHAMDDARVEMDRRKNPTAIVLLDLDHFKAINDSFGHESGDRILVNLVEILRSRVREEDGVFRLGGEEFVVLLPGTDLEAAERIAGQFRRSLMSQLEGPGGSITASFGVAELGADESVRQWLSRADEALYEAKRSGRNRVVVAPVA